MTVDKGVCLRRGAYAGAFQYKSHSAEVEEGELWGPENGLRHEWTTNGLNLSAILVQLHVIPGKGDGLMVHASACRHRPTH